MSGIVLLVHDDLATIATARRVLVSEGLEVVLATSSADAIISFGQRPTALVVLAPAVDGGRGPAVYAEIRSLPQGEGVRFILLGQAIAEAEDAAQVALPIDADSFRAAVQRALATEGAGWQLQVQRSAEQDDAPDGPAVTDSPDPWRIADPAQTLSQDEPLADQLFGDLRSIDETGGAEARVPSGATPIAANALPSAEPPELTEPDAVPPELQSLPLSDESTADPVEAQGPSHPRLERPATVPDHPTLDRAFEELEAPTPYPAEVVPPTAANPVVVPSGEQASAREAKQAELEAAQAELAETKRSRAAADQAHARVDVRLQQLEIELAAVEADLQAERSARQEREARLAEAEEKLAEQERARATAAGRLAAERQAREAADRTLAATLQRHEALASAVGDLEAQLRVEAAQLEELEARHREAQARAHSDETASEASKEQARAHAERIAALEAQCQEAEARAKQQVAERAELEHALEILGTQLADLERSAREHEARAVAESESLAELEAQKVALDKDRRTLEELSDEAERRARDLQARRAQTQASVQQLQQKNAVAAERLQTLERAREAAEIKLAQATRAEEKARSELEAAQARQAELEAAADEARAAASEGNASFEELSRARDAAVREAEKTERQLEALQASLADHQGVQGELERGRTEAEQRLATLRSQVQAAGSEGQAAAARVTEEKRALAELQKRLTLAADTLEMALEERSQRLQELEQLEDARAQVDDELRGINQRLETLAREEATQAQRRTEGLADLQGRRARLEEQLASLQARVETHAESVSALEAERTRAEAELQEISKRALAAKQEVEAVEARHAELTAALEELRAKQLAARSEAETAAARRAEFEKLVAEAELALREAPAITPEVVLAPELNTRAETQLDLPKAQPPRARVRPLSGGRFKRPELPVALDAAPVNALDPSAPPPLAEGPLEPRSPSFDVRGDLAALGAAGFFASIWKDRVTGRFDLELHDGARALFFEGGRLVAALSSAPADRLESIAQREGLITRAQERALRAEGSELPPRQLAVRMLELQLIKGTELYGLVRRHMEQVAYSLFSAEHASYRYSPELAPTEHRVALPTHALAFMLEGIRRKADFDPLNRALGGPAALVRLRNDGPELSQLGLSAREARFAGLINGLRTVEELVFASGLEPAAVAKLLYGMQAAGSVDIWPGEPPDESRSPERAIDLTRVGEKYEQVRNGDYFEILGVTAEATSYEVRAAFERLAREFHPARFAGVEDPQIASRLDEIGRAVAEAADVLSDDHTRLAYAGHLTRGG